MDLVPLGTQPSELIFSAARAVTARYAELDKATGIMCFSEFIALGVQQVLREHGLEVPRDRSLIGFDDLYAELALPPLTVVRFPLADIGKRVAEMAIAMTEGPAAIEQFRGRRETSPSLLIIRGSTGAPPLLAVR